MWLVCLLGRCFAVRLFCFHPVEDACGGEATDAHTLVQRPRRFDALELASRMTLLLRCSTTILFSSLLMKVAIEDTPAPHPPPRSTAPISAFALDFPHVLFRVTVLFLSCGCLLAMFVYTEYFFISATTHCCGTVHASCETLNLFIQPQRQLQPQPPGGASSSSRRNTDARLRCLATQAAATALSNTTQSPSPIVGVSPKARRRRQKYSSIYSSTAIVIDGRVT